MTDPGDDRLDEVQRRIDEARDKAEADDILIDPDEQRFSDSGSEHPEQDDQTIAPG
jgi:hypothetical protein